MDAMQKGCRHIRRETMMKQPIILDNNQDANFLSDNNNHSRHFGYHTEKRMTSGLPDVRTNTEASDDTSLSLDDYIPCFVKKVKGMKPFLIDIKPATTFRRIRGNISDCYDKQYSSTKNEGSSRNFSNKYSPTAAAKVGNSSYHTSWSLDSRNKEMFSSSRQDCQIPRLSNQPVCGPYPGSCANYNAADKHHQSGNFIRSSPTNYQQSPQSRHYKYNHQPVRNHDVSTRGPRLGKSKDADHSEYNRTDFVVSYTKAKFFMIKSYSENDVYNSLKYSVWSSTPHGNKKLDMAYRDVQNIQEVEGTNCPIFLFFSVNSSAQFVGLAEMLGPVDFKKNMDFWLQDRWTGFFPLKWHIVKDIPNYNFRDITLENNENKVVTFSRDTQEIGLPQGLKMLSIFKEYEPETSLLDDFEFYEQKQKLAKNNSATQHTDDGIYSFVQ